jgi:uncharacterized protein YbjT (DUF2867 family)
MKVILLGATGMVGQGVLRECLLDPGVHAVLAVGRHASGQTHAKLRDVVLPDLTDYSKVRGDLAGADACFYCLGVASAGMSEADYRRVTYDIAVAAAKALVVESPAMTFVFVSGAGTDAASRTMWARVKGETENAILALPFKAAHAFRPGCIQPLDGIRSRTRLYRVLYTVTTPLFPVLRALFGRHLLTTRSIGRAMLKVAREGAPKRVLEAADINALAGP